MVFKVNGTRKVAQTEEELGEEEEISKLETD